MTVSSAVFAVVLLAVGFVVPALADEEPKRGGTLNYMIPADAPPSFDAHREGTFATLYSGAPFYSVLIRVDPNNPSSTTDFVCDLCMPFDGVADLEGVGFALLGGFRHLGAMTLRRAGTRSSTLPKASAARARATT